MHQGGAPHIGVPYYYLSCSQARLDTLATLPRVTGLKSLPCRNRASLHTDHILVCLIRAKVGHALGLLNPGVPDNYIGESFPSDREESLIVRGGGDDDRLGGV
jgi:hypothetical protein